MAAIDYSGIIRQLVTIFGAESETQGVRVFVEENPQFGMADNGRAIAIYLLSRASHPNQVFAANKRMRYMIRIAVTAFGFHIENFQEAEKLRDVLLANVELVLMRDPTIGGKASTSWLDGGEFASARGPHDSVFVAAADTILMVDATAINT